MEEYFAKMRAFIELMKNPKVDVKDGGRIYTDVSS
jgi:hypothetical protein